MLKKRLKDNQMTKKEAVKGTAVALDGKTTLATREERNGQGSSNVTSDDLAIPRIKLLQAINEEVQVGNPAHVEGAQAGLIMNSVSKELTSSLFVINLNFTKEFVAWRKRKQGGGIQGSYSSEAEARVGLQEAGENEENFDIVENPCHLLFVINELGQHVATALLDMPSTKRKVSKAWNTLILDSEKAGQPRFSTVWELASVVEKNAEGTHFNYGLTKVGTAPDAIYDLATAEYDAFFGEKKEAA
jgi:hypothetical protein